MHHNMSTQNDIDKLSALVTRHDFVPLYGEVFVSNLVEGSRTVTTPIYLEGVGAEDDV